MAEGTRLKSLEEQLKKQEGKIQGLMDSTQGAIRSLEEKLGANSGSVESSVAEMKGFMAALSNQFNNLMKLANTERDSGHS